MMIKQGLFDLDNFIYALDLVQCCKQRKRKTLVLKLDFRKAFDIVSWDCLLDILRIRGFDQKWLDWMRALMQAAKTAILLNGIPGPWIQIKRGLRQGGSVFTPTLHYPSRCFAASDQKILGSGDAKTPHCDRPNLPGNPIYG
jgi:hypothetical protein